MSLSPNDPEVQLALTAPLCPGFLREDAIVTQGNGWHRTLTPSSPWAADDNEILFSNLGEEADKDIKGILAEYQALGRPMRWCVYPWTQPADLAQRLSALGATVSQVVALIGDTSLPLQQVAGADIVKIDPADDKEYDAYIKLMASGIMSSGRTLPAETVEFRRHRYRQLMQGEHPTLQLFLARCKGEVAGCGAVYIKEDRNSAWMTGDYVAQPYQARGLFQSLIAVRLQALREQGIKWATGHGRTETSVPWLVRFGFRPIFSYSIYQIDAPEAVKNVT